MCIKQDGESSHECRQVLPSGSIFCQTQQVPDRHRGKKYLHAVRPRHTAIKQQTTPEDPEQEKPVAQVLRTVGEPTPVEEGCRQYGKKRGQSTQPQQRIGANRETAPPMRQQEIERRMNILADNLDRSEE